MPDLPFATFLALHPRTILVELVEARGSTPREAGTFMLVADRAIWGTIGGGQFEYMAIDNARAMLAGGGEAVMTIPLGPEIGQCCGGRTRLSFSEVTGQIAAALGDRMRKEEDARRPVFLFGSGHVGLALARALTPLPFAVTVVETRAEALEDLPGEVARRLTAMPEGCIAEIPSGGAAIILTHDHALDFLIAERALSRHDLGYVGMIGSATKRVTFAHWLKRQAGEDGDAEAMMGRLVLPVGGSVVRDKRPAVIAALIAAELLHRLPPMQPKPTSERQIATH
ncbi:xanthine dehydrogenase accessory protein XdhC [Aliirhizobium terrae]|uniref:xanthine dehydrogenase accessory protein XdhC n=1 Tax=Terrirhizobium terrae TaxID=2926709 RepID=UPI0025778F75|nr:xanthine dehydrogenase accessory protein XdhC [Rhizobium sp. CC-CFT758]WJH40508.1 xanthine dehydrogenase accessory protein XdhC [Rhizobium sp. CC-CFT758]